MTRATISNGAELRARLDALGLPYAEAARRLGTSRQTMNNLMNATRLSSGMRARIALLFGSPTGSGKSTIHQEELPHGNDGIVMDSQTLTMPR